MMSKRRAYACQWCGHHIYPCVGTIFEGSRTPLRKWFYAIYLFSTTKHGVAAKELERILGVTYKTAWRMAHRIRELMAQTEEEGLLEGVVEVDETYIGGKRRGNKYKGPASSNKTVLFGAVERGGKVRTQVVASNKRQPLKIAVQKSVVPTSTVYSDQLLSYRGLNWLGYRHDVINHRRSYVDGGIHTNTIEGFWSRLKNSIRGTHVWVSRLYLQKYADKFAYRYNHRRHPEMMFYDLLLRL